jgi:hypothetical protein
MLLQTAPPCHNVRVVKHPDFFKVPLEISSTVLFEGDLDES